MPHKHTRKRDGDDKNFDLAPNRVAKPLPAFEKLAKTQPKGKKPQEKDVKRKRSNTGSYKQDDTPREFARIMQMQSGQKRRSGLDDGEDRKSKKKRKTEASSSKSTDTTQKADATAEPLKILPGERLADFAARVNQALPLSGLEKKGKQVDGMKQRQTKTEKRLHKMYAEWRVEEARRKEKEEEFQEQQEEQNEEQEAALGGQSISFPKSRRKQKLVGEIDDNEGDPWAVLKTKREAPKGLHDVAQAPPSMTVVPKEKFKVRNGAKVDVANVPGAAGSLKRREELGEARQEVINRYRAMMKGQGKL